VFLSACDRIRQSDDAKDLVGRFNRYIAAKAELSGEGGFETFPNGPLIDIASSRSEMLFPGLAPRTAEISTSFYEYQNVTILEYGTKRQRVKSLVTEPGFCCNELWPDLLWQAQRRLPRGATAEEAVVGLEEIFRCGFPDYEILVVADEPGTRYHIDFRRNERLTLRVKVETARFDGQVMFFLDEGAA
jgi:hypothetical protein